MHSITSIAQVEASARAAAAQYIDVNDACPFPFHSTAGYLFRNAFLAERNRMLLTPTHAAPPCTN